MEFQSEETLSSSPVSGFLSQLTVVPSPIQAPVEWRTGPLTSLVHTPSPGTHGWRSGAGTPPQNRQKTPENVKEKLKEHEERVRTDLKGLVHLKMKIMSPSCRSKPVRPSFIFGTQIKMFLMKSEHSIDSNTTEMFPGPET